MLSSAIPIHLVTFWMFFKFMSLFLAAGACLSLPSITEQQACPHRLVYTILAEESYQALESTMYEEDSQSPCTRTIFLFHQSWHFVAKWFVCVRVKKMPLQRKPYSSSVTSLNCLVTCEKAMGCSTAQCKMLLFYAITIMKESHDFE